MWFSVGCTPIDNEYASLQWTKRKNVWEKSNDTYSLLIRVQTTLSHILTCFFYHNINIQENVFLERELKKALRDTLTRAAWYGLLSTTAN